MQMTTSYRTANTEFYDMLIDLYPEMKLQNELFYV